MHYINHIVYRDNNILVLKDPYYESELDFKVTDTKFLFILNDSHYWQLGQLAHDVSFLLLLLLTSVTDIDCQ